MSIAALRPLRHRPFAILFSGSIVSNIGTWMETVAVGALVYRSTGRASWTTLVAVATFVPLGVLGPLGGVLADRIDRRRFLMAANAFEASLAALLAVMVATHHARPVLILAVVFCEGCSSGLRFPFQQSVLPDLVPRDDLLGAAALGGAAYNAGRVAGPALAAIVVSAGGYAWAFVVNAISFFAVITSLLFVDIPPPAVDPHDGDASVVARLRGGARTAWANRACRSAIILIAVAAALSAPFIALVPVKAGTIVGRDGRALARVTGVLTTAQGIGAVLGALMLGSLGARFGMRRVVTGALVATTCSVALYAHAPGILLSAAAIFLVGGFYLSVLSGLGTVVQMHAPAEARGRILGIYSMALSTAYPIGATVQGALADHFGLAATMTAAAALMLVVVVFSRRPLLRSL